MKNTNPVELHKAQFKGLKPSMRWDKHTPLEQWSVACREKMKDVLGLHTFSICDPDLTVLGEDVVNGNRRIRFLVQTEVGYYVNCHLLLPLDPPEKKLPLCACLQGHVSGAHLTVGVAKFEHDETYIEHECNFGVQAVAKGFAALAIEQRGFGENGGNTEHGWTQCQHAAMVANLMGRSLIGERVWDVQRVLDAVLDHFGDRITMDGSVLLGESGGGTATYYTACLEDRFSLYMPIVALCTFEDSIVDISHCVCNYVPGVAKYFDMGDMAVMIAPKRMVIVSATEDEWFPLDGAKEAFEQVKRIYRAAGAEDKCAMVVGEGPHRFYAGLAWPVVLELLSK